MGGISGGQSKAQSQQQSTAQSFVDPLTQQFRGQLFGAGSQLAGQQLGPGGISDVAGQLGGALLGQGLGGLNQLNQFGQGAAGQQQGFGQAQQAGQNLLGAQTQGGLGQGLLGRQGLGLDPASQALQAQAFGQNPALQQQIGQLGTDITRQFQQGLLPGIQSEAVGAGQLGGGRQGVAQGIGIQGALDAFQRGATDLRGQDIGRQLQAAQALGGLTGGAAQSLGGLQQQGFGQQIGAQQAAGQLGLGQQQQGLAGQLGAGQLELGGLESLQGLFNLGLSPFQAEFQPLQNLAGLLGISAPTVSQQQSTGSSKSSSFNFGITGGG